MKLIIDIHSIIGSLIFAYGMLFKDTWLFYGGMFYLGYSLLYSKLMGQK